MSSRNVGIVGVPPVAVIRELNSEGCRIYDLDEPQVNESLDIGSNYLPRVYCAILRTVIINIMHLELDAVYIDVGPGKCDCALHAARVIEDSFAIEVIRTVNEDRESFGTPICRARMELLEKFKRITRGVQTAEPGRDFPPCKPEAGFWGVPPRDFSILRLFPDTTHVYGWTRCMENKTPADLRLESCFNPDIPTVFFAQSFCAKNALAHHLARLHPRSLYLDCDVTAGSSARAKIEAFLELSGVRFRRDNT